VANRPNILWICTDQQRRDTLGCYGNRFVRTPHLDLLARQSALFSNCFVQSPICQPSRASFLTGRYPRTTRLRQNGQILPAGEKPVSRLLADEGYFCGLVGKFHMAPGDPAIAKSVEPRIDDGFAEFNWAQSPSDKWGMHSDYTRFLAAKGIKFSLPAHPLSRWIHGGMPEGASEIDWCADRAIDFIRRGSSRKEPWFFLADIFAPHHPFNPGERFLAPYLERLQEIPLPDASDDDLSCKPAYQAIDSEGAYGRTIGFGRHEMSDTDHRLVRAAYWAMCDQIDDRVGTILAALDDAGVADNTIVIFMSDHGEMLGDHGIYLKGPYFYDAAIRVPLMIRLPDRIAPAEHRGLFEAVDLVPTLLDLCAIPRHPGIQGRSVAAGLAGGVIEGARSVYSEYYNAMPFHTDPTAQLTMARTERWKIVVDHAHDDGELYDMEADPLEKVNLWRDRRHLDTKTEMLTLLTHRMAFTVDPLPPRLSEW
jgi:arylsulfatase A-like enzyme